MKAKDKFCVVLSLCLVLICLYVNSGYAQFAGGEGTEETPYLVETAQQLHNVRYHLDSYFRQISDIDLSSYSAGEGWEPISGFEGTYYGSGYKISNLIINRPFSNDVGLFGYTNGASISGVRLIGVSIIGQDNVGSIVGNSKESTIYLCYAIGSISGRDVVGGLTGYQGKGVIIESYSLIDTKGSEFIGGLVGKIVDGIVENCYAVGDINGDSCVGGLIGYFDANSQIVNCYSSGLVKGDNDVGGLIGKGNGSVTSSYWDTETSSHTSSAGGEGRTTIEMTYPHSSNTYINWELFCTWMEDEDSHFDGYPFLTAAVDLTPLYPVFPSGDGTENNPFEIATINHLNWIRNSGVLNHWNHFRQAADIDLSETIGSNLGWKPIGGGIIPFIGYYWGDGHTISNLNINRESENFVGLFGLSGYSNFDNIHLDNVDVRGNSYVGALIGFNYIGEFLTNCTVDGFVTGVQSVGGLVGISTFSLIENCHTNVRVLGIDLVGGLIGEGIVYINQCSSTGVVGWEESVSGIGGLIGRFIFGSIERSFSSCDVEGVYRIGGLVGTMNGYDDSYSGTTEIINSYSTGNVKGRNYVGGLVGFSDMGGDIIKSYATGKVQGDTNVGGLISPSYGLASYCYWDKVATGQEESYGGVLEYAAVTVDMVLSPFLYTNWDFQNIWSMTGYTTYPYLQWQDEPGIHNYPPNGYHKAYQGRTFYWESFPVLWNRNTEGWQTAQEVLDPLIYNYPGLDHIEVWNEHQQSLHWDGLDWLYFDPIDFHSTRGYQVSFGSEDEFELIVEGNNGVPENIPFNSGITIYPQNIQPENWISYFIPQTQRAEPAFQSIAGSLKEIQGEEWGMYKLPDGSWIHDGNEDPVVVFGKMYKVITLYPELTVPLNFNWPVPSEILHQQPREKPEFFVYDEKPSYESFFIEEIENDEGVLEVAVFAGNECVGARVFHANYPLEIQAFTDESHLEEEISFAIYRDGQRGEMERIYAPAVKDIESGEYVAKTIKPQRQSFTIVKLDSDGTEIEEVVKPQVVLSQNYPNPFCLSPANRSFVTEIPFYVSEVREVTLSIYNIKGQMVRTLYEGTATAGKHSIGWNGLNDQNRPVGSGVYFYRLESRDKTITKKMLLIR